MQRPIKQGLPHLQKLVNLGESGCEIVVLPNVGLKSEFEVWDAIEEVCGKAAATSCRYYSLVKLTTS